MKNSVLLFVVYISCNRVPNLTLKYFTLLNNPLCVKTRFLKTTFSLLLLWQTKCTALSPRPGATITRQSEEFSLIKLTSRIFENPGEGIARNLNALCSIKMILGSYQVGYGCREGGRERWHFRSRFRSPGRSLHRRLCWRLAPVLGQW